MFEKCIYFNANALVRRLNRIWDQAYEPSGLSAPHAYLLRLVCQSPGILQRDAAKQLVLEKSTVTRFVVALQGKGLLRREPGSDARELLLFPTEDGKRLGKTLDKIGKGLYQRMRKELGVCEFDILVTALRTGVREIA